MARYKRTRGFDVLHPMGWDAFGCRQSNTRSTPAAPRRDDARNIETFRRQLKALGFSYDWSREVDTTDPKYVRWTQWIFLKLFHKGLASQAEVPVNWCPALGTVLANEEVIDGRSERGNHPVIRKPLRQWQLKITRYADRLAEDLEPLEWPETKQKQRDWIGKSEGAKWTSRSWARRQADCLHHSTGHPYGATYMVIAPDHRLRSRSPTTSTRKTSPRTSRRLPQSDIERTA